MAEEKKSDEHINLKVTGQDGSVVHFKIKKMTPLRKLMSAYCERTGVKMGSMRFRFDGQPINETDTPSQLDMEDGDAIDVFQQQTGGRTFISSRSSPRSMMLDTRSVPGDLLQPMM